MQLGVSYRKWGELHSSSSRETGRAPSLASQTGSLYRPIGLLPKPIPNITFSPSLEERTLVRFHVTNGSSLPSTFISEVCYCRPGPVPYLECWVLPVFSRRHYNLTILQKEGVSNPWSRSAKRWYKPPCIVLLLLQSDEQATFAAVLSVTHSLHNTEYYDV